MDNDQMEKMEKAAEEAAEVLEKMSKEEIDPVGTWFLEWYPKAGYKKLGKALVAYMKKRKEKEKL